MEITLGTGGFGITYLARDTSLGRKVVIKENLPSAFAFRDTASGTVRPRSSLTEDTENFAWSLQNFLREADTLASLNHPGIVSVLRKFEANGTAYFVMPFQKGVGFDQYLKSREERGNPLSEDELKGLLEHVLDALDYLHARGIYHRDIKPGNILVTKKGVPVLIDFGSARQRLSERTMTVLESSGYTPFEQVESGGNVGPWSDLYALGATVSKAITGETPPKSADRMRNDPYVLLGSRPELQTRYSGGFLSSLDRVLQVDESARWQDAGEWLGALDIGNLEEEGLSEEAQGEDLESSSGMVECEKGDECFESGEEEEAARWYRISAGKGHAEGQYNLGWMYAEGRGVEKNEEQAAKWFREASGIAECEKGDECLESGEEEEAARWYRISAERGHAEGQYNLGWMCEEGRGLEQNQPAAREWYRKAAEQGDPGAQNSLGVCYENGEGVWQDPTAAVGWYRKAGEQGLAEGQYNLALCYWHGNGIEEDDEMAAKWFEKAAEQGDADAQWHLGFFYGNGYGVGHEDDARALHWYRKAAERGHANAQCELGLRHETGVGVVHDDEEAVMWYRKAAAQGNEIGQMGLGSMYEKGRGVGKNMAEAAKWYRKAAEQGHSDAQNKLGLLYEFGRGVEKDEVEAVKWFRMGAEKGHEPSQRHLQEMLSRGGTKRTKLWVAAVLKMLGYRGERPRRREYFCFFVIPVFLGSFLSELVGLLLLMALMGIAWRRTKWRGVAWREKTRESPGRFSILVFNFSSFAALWFPGACVSFAMRSESGWRSNLEVEGFGLWIVFVLFSSLLALSLVGFIALLAALSADADGLN